MKENTVHYYVFPFIIQFRKELQHKIAKTAKNTTKYKKNFLQLNAYIKTMMQKKNLM